MGSEGVWYGKLVLVGSKVGQESFSPFFSWAERGPCDMTAPAVCSGHVRHLSALAGQQREALVQYISSGDTGHSSRDALRGVFLI